MSPQRLAILPAEIRDVIAREARYAKTRWVEIWLSVIMTLTGVILLLPGETFSLAVYNVVARYTVEDGAGFIALVFGICRLAALRINGEGRRTPLVRVAGCAGGFLFWSALSLGLWFAVETDLPLSLGLAVFPILAIAELHASGTAGGDVFILDSLGTRERRRDRERKSAGSR